MAVLGFSHITSEVADLEASIEFYQRKGFTLKFNMTMPVPACKYPVVEGRPTQVRLAYMIYAGDEACNLELIRHDCQSQHGPKGPRLSPMFFTRKTAQALEFDDPDGNHVMIMNPVINTYARHYILPVNDLEKSVSFYKKFFMREDNRPEFADFLKGAQSRSLTFQSCLHAHWNGYLHLIHSPFQDSAPKPLNGLGFYSFCFLVSHAQKDIYNVLGPDNVFGPIQENKKVNDKTIGFKVGFFYDPSGFPVEYLELV